MIVFNSYNYAKLFWIRKGRWSSEAQFSHFHEHIQFSEFTLFVNKMIAQHTNYVSGNQDIASTHCLSSYIRDLIKWRNLEETCPNSKSRKNEGREADTKRICCEEGLRKWKNWPKLTTFHKTSRWDTIAFAKLTLHGGKRLR